MITERIVGTTARLEARERAVENGSTPSKRTAVQKNLEDNKSPPDVNGRIRLTETRGASGSVIYGFGGGALTSQQKSSQQ